MKRIIFLVIIMVVSSGCLNRGTNQQPEPLRCGSIGSGRGITVDFISNAPPREITEGRRFTVSLKFANYNKDAMNVQYLLQDSTDAEGFEDQSGSVLIDGATIDERNRRLYEPGCKLFGENLAEKNLGIFSYRNLEFDDYIDFVVRINYDYVALLDGNFCVYNPALGGVVECSDRETISNLGLSTAYDPVTVTSVSKQITSLGTDSVLIVLDMMIENLGGGRIKGDKETLNFRINSPDGLSFDCISENIAEGSRRGNNLLVYLFNKRANVKCESEASADRFVKYSFNIELEYPYEYYASTGQIKLINVKNG